MGIVGAGFSGAVIARELADAGIASVVMDERRHLAGNCHTERDGGTGVMVHRYGPHIFHTDKPHVWDYVTRYGEMMPFTLRVKSTHRGRVYSVPINLHTINQFFDRSMSPEQARQFIAAQACDDIEEPRSFEEQALKFVGAPLYEAFLRGYTRKQWGIEPAQLPASILKRLPLRFDYNDNYYNHPYQAIPRDGYTAIVQNIVDHPRIELRLGCRFEDVTEDFSHQFYSGSMDRYFGYSEGRLGYRTCDFDESTHPGDFQGAALMNYADEDIPFTRITEHKHFAPWEAPDFAETVIYHVYSRACGPGDIPYYPIRLVEEMRMLEAYKQSVREETGVTFVGRLGTYQYIDMDVTIDGALAVVREYLVRVSGRSGPSR